MRKFALLLAFLFSATVTTFACTSFLVGKKASVDGSVFITYSMDSYGAFARLTYYPAAKHPAGTMRRIVDGDTNHYLGMSPEAPETYAVMGQINEHQLSIMETTFGGREELVDTTGGIDYGTKRLTYPQNFGGGGGTGLSITPIAFLTVSRDSDVNLIHLNSSSELDRITSLFERSPEIIEKIKNMLS